MLPSPVVDGLVREGSAGICVDVVDKNGVFYNPAQVLNRDLSIVVIRAFASLYNTSQKTVCSEETSNEKESSLASRAPAKLRILEPLAASGIVA